MPQIALPISYLLLANAIIHLIIIVIIGALEQDWLVRLMAGKQSQLELVSPLWRRT